jgi:hypothetical protein
MSDPSQDVISNLRRSYQTRKREMQRLERGLAEWDTVIEFHHAVHARNDAGIKEADEQVADSERNLLEAIFVQGD